MTNADLIAEARRNHKCLRPAGACDLMKLADALEASEAQVARLTASMHDALAADYTDDVRARIELALRKATWPADLLAAVQEAILREADDLPDEIREARATLRRYGLLGAAPVEGARP